MRKLRHIAVGALCAVGALLPVQFFGATAAQAVTFTNLTLLNGWTAGPFGTGQPSVAIIGGIVHFRGAIATSGTNPEPFVLPASFRPSTNIFVPVDLCNATNGRLDIAPSGAVSVQQQSGDPSPTPSASPHSTGSPSRCRRLRSPGSPRRTGGPVARSARRRPR